MFKQGEKLCRKTERFFIFPSPPSQDQYDQIEKHTQSGIDLLELYVKFVKERTEIEQSYAKQLRCVYMPLCFPLTPAMPGAVNHKSHNPAFWRQESDQEVRQAREQGWTRLQVRGEHMFHVCGRMISDKSAFLKRCWSGGLTRDLGTHRARCSSLRCTDIPIKRKKLNDLPAKC